MSPSWCLMLSLLCAILLSSFNLLVDALPHYELNANLFRDIALKTGTDKVTSHGYEYLYGPWTKELRKADRVKFLEIGLGCGMGYGPGASADLWRQWLGDTAELWFGEYDAKCVQAQTQTWERLKLNMLVGDQAHLPTLKKWTETSGGNFDVIVDDGGHTQKQKFNSIVKLWTCVKPGGLFITEDMQVDRHKAYVAHFDVPTVEIYESWIDQLAINRKWFHFDGHIPANPNARKWPLPPGLKLIYCIHEACLMMKCASTDQRPPCRDLGMSVRQWEDDMLRLTNQVNV